MTRVLEVVYGFGYGGIRACIQNYVTHIDKNEFQVDIYVYAFIILIYLQYYDQCSSK